MVTFDYSFTTSLPIEKTFSFIAENFFDNLHVWNSALQKVEKLTPGAVTTGTKGYEVQLVQGKPYERKFEVVTYEKNKLFAVKSISEGIPKERYCSSFAFALKGNMTHITFHFELELYSVAFRLFQVFIKKNIAGDVTKNVENLKKYLDETASH